MRAVGIVIGVMAGIALLVVVVGTLLPEGHQSSAQAYYASPPDEVWQVVSDVQGSAGWRSDVDAVEPVPGAAGGGWREVGRHGETGYRLVEVRPGEYMVARIEDPQRELPYSGVWRWQLEAADGGSLLTLTENGEVRNPVFRFVSRFLLGHHGTMERYLRDLGQRLGQDVEPERLPEQPYDPAFGQ